MTSPCARLLGAGAALILIGLTGPALGQMTLQGTVTGLQQSQVCSSTVVEEICGLAPGELIGGVFGSPPSNNSFATYEGTSTNPDCDFTVELFNNGNKSVNFEDMSDDSQFCGTQGAEVVAVRNKNSWGIYCGDNVIAQNNIAPPAGSGNNSAEQVAICFAGGLCGAESQAGLVAACNALGTDYVIGDDILGGGKLNICACPGRADAIQCDPTDTECLFDNTAPKYMEGTTGVQQGTGSCKTLCKSSTGGTGSAYNQCVAICRSAS